MNPVNLGTASAKTRTKRRVVPGTFLSMKHMDALHFHLILYGIYYRVRDFSCPANGFWIQPVFLATITSPPLSLKTRLFLFLQTITGDDLTLGGVNIHIYSTFRTYNSLGGYQELPVLVSISAAFISLSGSCLGRSPPRSPFRPNHADTYIGNNVRIKKIDYRASDNSS